MSEYKAAGGTVSDAIRNGYALIARDPNAAIAQAQTILKSAPCPAALRLMGAALRAKGRSKDGELAELDAVRASLASQPMQAAITAKRQGKLAEMERILVGVLRDDPDDPAALLLLGESVGKLGYFRRAEEMLRRATRQAPAYLDAQIALASLLAIQSREEEAIPIIDMVLSRQPGHMSTTRFKTTLLTGAGKHDDAVVLCQQLAEAHPQEIALWISLGDALRTAGRKADADAAYRRALALNRRFGRSWWAIAAIRHAPITADEIAEMEAALVATASQPDNCYYLNFALGTAYAEGGDHARAFAAFDAGNRLRQTMQRYDPATVTREVERTEKLLTPAFFAERKGYGHDDPAPIFVLGMPRSGSTLVEQILASHPLIEGTAELPIIPVLIRLMASDHGLRPEESYRDLLARVPAEEFAALGREYLRRAAPHRLEGRPFFIDKLPHNWADVGFIQLALPNAKIIDTRRNPMDCCWSNYRLLFATGHPSSNSQEHMAAYYRDYVRMMRHFDAALPGRVHRVVYERLVADPEGQVRAMLDYLGVPFDPACLRFHETKRAVATASSEQVRRPMNRDGLDTWQPYAQWLGPMQAALGDLVDRYAD